MQNIKYIFLFALFITNFANAATPTESCPTGYITVNAKYTVLSDGACPAGTIKVGTASSCLIMSPSGKCFMYVPTGNTYSDNSGEYKYNGICPLSVAVK